MTVPGRRLPQTARELFRLPLRLRLPYELFLAFVERSGVWAHSQKAYGDIERMRLFDKLYWLHKASRPIRRARRGSGLEDYFSRPRELPPLPAGLAEQARMTVSAAGDVMPHPYLAASAETLYQEVESTLFDVDLAMANLEAPILERAPKPFVFAFEAPPPLSFQREDFAVARGRFGFLATACNHTLDFGAEGVSTTLSTLERAGISQSGIQRGRPFALTQVERRGVRLGIVAITFGLNGNGRRPHPVNVLPLNDDLRTLDLGPLKRQIECARREGVELVIAHLHWGLEHELYPTPEQVETAHHLAELGVDVIVGHHPHVLQPFELYRTQRDPARAVPIYYSLGNLVNPFMAPWLCRSGVARVAFVKGTLPSGETRVYVAEAGLVRVRQEIDVVNERIRIVLEDA